MPLRTERNAPLFRLGFAGLVLMQAVFLSSCSTQGADAPAPSMPGDSATHTATTGGGAPSSDSPFEKPRKESGSVSIQIVTNGISPFWDPMAIGMEKAAKELDGCSAQWTGPQNSEVGEQKKMIEAAMAKGVDGIAISCIEAKASEAIINAVLEKGIPVITFDSDSPDSKRLVYIGTNNFNAGKAAGDAAIKLLPNGGKFVGFVGNISAQNARERRDGFVEAAKAGKIELLDVLDDNKGAERARRNVEDTIAKRKDEIQGLLGLFSYNGPAIANAIESQPAMKGKYKIVAFDAEPVTLKKLEAGAIDATVVQKPYDFGYLSTKLLYLINRKGLSAALKELNVPESRIYDTGVEVITPATVKDYKKKLEEIGVKSS